MHTDVLFLWLFQLWMGAHIKAPSLVRGLEQPLSLREYIQIYPRETLSDKLREVFGSDELPFLFKVLAVGKALSIQAHPDKTLASKLHIKSPHLYSDPNHKPEMAIAFDRECHALVGFRPTEEIAFFLNNVPEFRDLVGVEIAEQFVTTIALTHRSLSESDRKTLLQRLFTRLMTSSNEQVTRMLHHHIARIAERIQEETHPLLSETYPCVLSLYRDFPDDVGVWCVYMLNHVHLAPLEAIYLEVNEPHAYLGGTFIECMATSDNVVRAGLTSKFKDVEVLCDMLTYECRPAIDHLWLPQRFDHVVQENLTIHLHVYQPKCREFRVLHLSTYSQETALFSIPSADVCFDGPCLMLVVEGSSDHYVRWQHLSFPLAFGNIFFIAAGIFHHLQMGLKADKPLTLFIASSSGLKGH
jgi:mannose-6-phosphate isomerase